MRLHLSLVFACCTVLAPVSLHAAKVRLYDLKTGTVSVLEYKNRWLMGHGPIKGTLATGQNVKGEFTTVPRSDTAWGAIYSGGTSASGLRTSISNDQRGSAVVSGDGIVMECEYVVSALSGHGSGFCKDNQENRYKVMF